MTQLCKGKYDIFDGVNRLRVNPVFQKDGKRKRKFLLLNCVGAN